MKNLINMKKGIEIDIAKDLGDVCIRDIETLYDMGVFASAAARIGKDPLGNLVIVEVNIQNHSGYTVSSVITNIGEDTWELMLQTIHIGAIITYENEEVYIPPLSTEHYITGCLEMVLSESVESLYFFDVPIDQIKEL